MCLLLGLDFALDLRDTGWLIPQNHSMTTPGL